MRATSKPFDQAKRKREASARLVVSVSRWTVRAYGRQVAVCDRESDAYRIADDYRWLGTSACVTPAALKVNA